MADISIRKWIRWESHSPTPPTSTIVLTSPQRRFVDIRVLLPLPTPPDSELPLEQLEWAIAGTSTSSPVLNPKTKEVEYSHCVWSHWIDSRVNNRDAGADEGDNYPVEGHPELTLERGRMVNPASGRVEGYEEMWVAGEVRAVEGVGCVVLEYDADLKGEEGWARGERGKQGEDERVGRGMVVQLGGYVQGFLRDGGDVRVERWVWEGERGKWEKRVRIGSGGLKGGEGVIPVEFVTEVGGQMEVGDEVMGVGGRRWRVVEKSLV